jgi:hypothetical protein
MCVVYGKWSESSCPIYAKKKKGENDQLKCRLWSVSIIGYSYPLDSGRCRLVANESLGGRRDDSEIESGGSGVGAGGGWTPTV